MPDQMKEYPIFLTMGNHGNQNADKACWPYRRYRRKRRNLRMRCCQPSIAGNSRVHDIPNVSLEARESARALSLAKCRQKQPSA